MKQTSEYQLNQWEKSDRIMMEDFNADNAKIEAALAALSTERVVLGSYTGNGTTNRVVSLPFTPKVVILLGHINAGAALIIATAEDERYVTSDSCGSGSNLRIVENGIKVGMTYASWGNESGKTERYIAFL